MTASIDNIVQHLFHQPSLQAVSVDELQQMTLEHPSFAAARFLLLKKMQETAHPDFASQLHKTSLYFNNPLWLQLLLSPMKEESIAWRPADGPATELIGHQADWPVEETLEQAQEPDEITERTAQQAHLPEEPETLAETAAVDIVDITGTDTTAMSSPAPQGEPLMQEVMDRLRGQIQEAEAQAEGGVGSPESGVRSRESGVGSPESGVRSSGFEVPGSEFEVRGAEFEVRDPESGAQRLESGVADPTAIPAEIAAQEDLPGEDDFAPFPDTIPESATASASVTSQVTEPGTPEPETTGFPTPDSDLPTPDSQPTPGSNQKIIIETPMAQHDVLFEPYHTIDYFASQGIRLDKMEPAPQDKLGRQLRSFTDWLKSMKRLPQAAVEKVLADNDESAVVAAATHSIEGKEVITEAMAEVFEKQGLRDKAIEVYRKLSLLNPAKSAYFADRINALKYS